jgi:NAD(P)-dependent dehydrogenase (short-subunit alcohol dehydrogenase family)
MGVLFAYFNQWYVCARLGKWDPYGAGDVALITGGSQGLGREIVKKLLKKKVQVIVIDIVDPDYHGSQFYRCDLSILSQVQSTMEQIISTLNRENKHITLVVNNAGVRHNESVINLSPEKIAHIFQINTFSQICIVNMVLNARGATAGGGGNAGVGATVPDTRLYLVTVASILGVFAPRNLSIYAASKAASIQIHQALTQEVSLNLLRTLLVTPGQLSTGMFSDIDPSNGFLAPVVDHIELASTIVSKIDSGTIGVVCEPFYANFIPMINSLPVSLQQFCRWFSGMDEKIKEKIREEGIREEKMEEGEKIMD